MECASISKQTTQTMDTNFKISIPKPCHEDWNKFTPHEKGAFCKVCSKSVHDFTKSSAEEIKTILVEEMSAGNKVCGRFNGSQLAPTEVIPSLSPYDLNFTRMKRFAIALFLVFEGYLFSSVKSSAQKMGKISIASRQEPIQGRVATSYTVPKQDTTSSKPKILCKAPPLNEEVMLGEAVIEKPVVKGNIEFREPETDIGLIEWDEQIIGDTIVMSEEITMGSISVTDDTLIELPTYVNPIPLDNDSALNDMQQIVGKDFSVEESTYVEKMAAPTLKGVDDTQTDQSSLQPARTSHSDGGGGQMNFECYPNPSRGLINIKYLVKENSLTSILLYDMTGSLIKTLVSPQKMYSADYSSQFDISELSDGIYFCTLQNGEEKSTQRIILGR